MRGTNRRPAGHDAAVPQPSPAPYALGLPARLRLPTKFDAASVREHGAAWNDSFATSPNNLVDASGVTLLDSTGVGFFMRLQKRCRSGGGTFVLMAPSLCVTNTLGLMRLDGFFDIAPDEASALRLIGVRDRERMAPSAGRHGSFSWTGKITSGNSSLLWAQVEPAFAEQWTGGSVVLDLSGVRFIDSAGVGLLVRLRKLAIRRDITLRLVNVSPQVMTVIRLVRLEDFLFQP